MHFANNHDKQSLHCIHATYCNLTHSSTTNPVAYAAAYVMGLQFVGLLPADVCADMHDRKALAIHDKRDVGMCYNMHACMGYFSSLPLAILYLEDLFGINISHAWTHACCSTCPCVHTCVHAYEEHVCCSRYEYTVTVQPDPNALQQVWGIKNCTCVREELGKMRLCTWCR